VRLRLLITLLFDLSERTEVDTGVFDVGKPLPVGVHDLEVENTHSDWTGELLHKSTNLFTSDVLKDGETNWSYSRIFDYQIFTGVQKIRLVEPDLFKSHQIRNLRELLLFITQNSKRRFVEIFTSIFPIDRREYNQKCFNCRYNGSNRRSIELKTQADAQFVKNNQTTPRWALIIAHPCNAELRLLVRSCFPYALVSRG
jgi:hypothetical protein